MATEYFKSKQELTLNYPPAPGRNQAKLIDLLTQMIVSTLPPDPQGREETKKTKIVLKYSWGWLGAHVYPVAVLAAGRRVPELRGKTNEQNLDELSITPFKRSKCMCTVQTKKKGLS